MHVRVVQQHAVAQHHYGVLVLAGSPSIAQAILDNHTSIRLAGTAGLIYPEIHHLVCWLGSATF